jgi:hypothetical protein
LLQHGSSGLHGSAAQHDTFEIITEGSGLAVLPSRVAVKFED